MVDKTIPELAAAAGLTAASTFPTSVDDAADATKATGTQLGALIGFLSGAATTSVTTFNVGAVGAPGMTFAGDLNTGIYWIGADSFGFSTGGTLRLSISTTAVVSTLPFSAPDGALATPAYANTGDLDTGMWFSAGNIIDFSCGAHRSLQLKNTNATDDAYLVVDSDLIDGANEIDITAAGSGTNISIHYIPKGTGNHYFYNTAGAPQFQISTTASAVNWIQTTGTITGSSPAFAALGSDTNIDLRLIPKGTGLVRFGTATASVATASTHQIGIKAADGTTYYLLATTVA